MTEETMLEHKQTDHFALHLRNKHNALQQPCVERVSPRFVGLGKGVTLDESRQLALTRSSNNFISEFEHGG